MEHSEQYQLEGTRAIGGNGTPMFETRAPFLRSKPSRFEARACERRQNLGMRAHSTSVYNLILL